MTVILVARAIKSFLTASLSGDVTVTPAIHIGYLPSRNKDNVDEPQYPFIIIRPMDGSESEDSHSVQIKLIFGTKSEDDEGYMDVLNLMERTRIALLQKGVLDSRFRLERPYTWKLYEEQPEPEWIGEAMTRWTLPAMIEEVEDL